MKGILRPHGLQGRLHRQRRGRRRRLPRLREHALPRAAALLRRSAVGRPERRLGRRAGAALRHGRAHARGHRRRRRTIPPTTSCAPSAASSAWTTPTRRRASASTSATRSATRTSAARAPSGRRARRAGGAWSAARVGAKNTLVKNYLWFAERNGTEILAGADGGRHPRRCRAAATRSSPSARARGCARTAARTRPRASSSPRARWAPTCCCSGASSPAACRSSRDAPRRARAHELRVRPRASPSRAGRRTSPGASRSRRQHLPRRRHAHRDRGLRQGGRLDELAQHADGRRRHARHPAAAAARGDRPPPAAASPGCSSTAGAGRSARSSSSSCRRSTTRWRCAPGKTRLRAA